MSSVAQRSFAKGEIAPSLFARTDQQGYATGLRTCRNFYVMRHGGITNRSGTRFIGNTLYPDKRVRLIPFIFNAEQTYVIELGHHYARFYRNAGRVTPGAVTAWLTATAYTVGDLRSEGADYYYCILAHTSGAATEPGAGSVWTTNWYRLFSSEIYEIPTPYDEADLTDIHFVQSADIITLVHPGYAARELKRYAATRWILSPVVYGPSIGTPTNLALGGGISGSTSYYAVTAISELTGEESLPAFVSGANHVPSTGVPSSITWDPVTGASSYNVYRSSDGRTYGLLSPSGGVPSETTDNSWSDATESARTILVQTWVPAVGQCRNTLTLSATNRPYDGNYTIRARATLSVGFGVTSFSAGRAAIYYSRDAEPRQLVATIPVSFAEAIFLTQRYVDFVVNIPDNGYTSLTIDVVPEVLNGGTGGSVSFIIDFTVPGHDEIAWNVLNSGTFLDPGATPDILQQPPKKVALFEASGKYPSTTTFYQERRMFGNTNTEPEKVWGSRTANYRDFGISVPLQDDDGISFSLAGGQVNEVKHLLDLGRLIVMTSGAEVSVEGDQSGILRPDSINPQQISRNGSGRLRPLPINDAAVYVQARQSIVRDLKPISGDQYEGTDLTVFAAHLFEGFTIADWAFAQTPHSIVWAARSDGVLLGLTYLREHAIWGWHRHDTLGIVENVCTVPEGREDAVYLVVKRFIDGAVRRYVERMESRYFTDQSDAFFVDAGISYNGWNDKDDTETSFSAVTMEVTGGTDWDSTELLTVTNSLGVFTADSVGDAVILRDSDGGEYRVNITTYTDSSNVKGFAATTIPVGLRAVPTTHWALALQRLPGLDHLEAENISVLGDGFVVASPNNADYAAITVVGGRATLDRPYAKIIAGLPFIADMETLDIDTPQGPSRKTQGTNITDVMLYVQKSRGIWSGQKEPSGDDPLEGLTEAKLRPAEDATDPPPLLTEAVQTNIGGRWNDNGRVFVRQVDPLPLTVLAAIPVGYLA